MVKKGNIVQFASDWENEPTPENTSIVMRTAKDQSWADVKTPYCTKRVPNPEKNLKVVTGPLIVHADD